MPTASRIVRLRSVVSPAIIPNDLLSQRPTGGTAWTLVNDTSWPSTTPSGWGIATNRPGPAPTLAADPTKPSTNLAGSSVDTSNTVLAQSYAGVTDGNEPQFPFIDWPGSREIFFATTVKFDASWVQPTSSGIKWHLFDGTVFNWFGLGNSTIVSGTPMMGWTSDTGTTTPVGRFDWVVPTANQANATLTKNVWHLLQYSLSSNPDRARIWVNNNLVLDTDTQAPGPLVWTSATHQFAGLQLGATWGGGIGFTAPAGNRIYYGRTAIWRRT